MGTTSLKCCSEVYSRTEDSCWLSLVDREGVLDLHFHRNCAAGEMSGEDLDSFFAEINQISADEVPAGSTGDGTSTHGSTVAAQVISKPAEINPRTVVVAAQAAVSSHPVYTYNQPELFANANYNYEQPEPTMQFYQNPPPPDSKPPPPAVAPPQVPRQNKVKYDRLVIFDTFWLLSLSL